MLLTTAHWKSALALVLALVFSTFFLAAFSASAESTTETPEVIGPSFLGPESDVDGKAYLEMRERIGTNMSDYIKENFGLSPEEFFSALAGLYRIQSDELDAYSRTYYGYTLAEIKRFEELGEKYRSGALGFGNETVKGIPKAKLLTRIFQEWEVRVLAEEDTCFWNGIDKYLNLRLTDGSYAADLFGLSREKPSYGSSQEEENAWHEAWIEFLKKITLDEYGYFHVEAPDGEDLRLLGGVETSVWIYNEEDFRSEYLGSLPYADRGIFNNN